MNDLKSLGLTNESLLEGLSDIEVDLDRPEDDEWENEFESLEEEEEFNHYENLVDYIDEEELEHISEVVIDGCERDLISRERHDEMIAKGLKTLGIEMSEESAIVEGSCTASHPMILEAAVKFQSKTSTELLPPSGPVNSKIIGTKTREKEERAQRTKNFMNYILMDKMEDYVDESDRLFLYTALIGNSYRKVSFESDMDSPRMDFVPYEQFVINSSAQSLAKANRYTHILYKSKNELKSDMYNEIYTEYDMYDPHYDKNDTDDVDYNMTDNLGAPSEVHTSEITEVIRDIIGVDFGIGEDDLVYELYEQHVYLHIEGDDDEETGLARPYVVTVHPDSGKVLSVVRNWAEYDSTYKKKMHFADYHFIPFFGFYSFGYIHILGGFQKMLTAIMRSLVDAGQFANFPAGFKAKGARMAGDTSPLGLGEWREIESINQDLGKMFFPLPYKGADPSLLAMYQGLEARGQKFADSTDQVVQDSSNYGAVGTTLALIEESSKFLSGIHKRFFNSQKKEFRILADTIGLFMEGNYPYEVLGEEGEQFLIEDDFSEVLDILPTADPNVSSTTQKITIAQAKLDTAQRFPNVADEKALLKDFFKTLDPNEDPSKYFPQAAEPKQADPMSDIIAATNGQPIKAFMGQDHDSHIQAKTAFMSDPAHQRDPLIQKAMPNLQANIKEHTMLKWQERMQAQMGQMPDQSEKAIAMAAEQITEISKSEVAMKNQNDPMQIAAKAEMLDAETNARKQSHQENKDAAEMIIKDREVKIKEKDQVLKEIKEQIRIEESDIKQKIDISKYNMDKSLDRLDREADESIKNKQETFKNE